MLSSDFKNQYPDIPWSVVSGLRHRLVHDYEGINWSIIVEFVFDEMDVFVNAIDNIIKLRKYIHLAVNAALLKVTLRREKCRICENYLPKPQSLSCYSR